MVNEVLGDAKATPTRTVQHMEVGMFSRKQGV